MGSEAERQRKASFEADRREDSYANDRRESSMSVKSMKDRMPCNKPTKTPGEKKSWKVKACEGGEERIVRFGDPKMPDRSDEPERRKSFRARHNCDSPGSKLKARYWSCRKWVILFCLALPLEILRLAS